MIDVPQLGQSTNVIAALRIGRGIRAAYKPPPSRSNAGTLVWLFPQVLPDRVAMGVIPALGAEVSRPGHTLLSSRLELLLPVNHDRFPGAALSAQHQGDGMFINPVTARIEWADRVARQSEQLLIIAKTTNDDDMRDELLGYAKRLNEQCTWIRASAA